MVRRRVRAAAAIVAAAMGIGVAAPHLGAADADGTVQEQVLELDAALAELSAGYGRLLELQPQIEALRADLTAAVDRRLAARADVARLGTEQAVAAERLAAGQLAVDEMARAAYTGNERGPLEELFVASDPVMASARRTLARSVVESRSRVVDELAAIRAEVDVATEAAGDRLAAALAGERARVAELDRAQAEQIRLQSRVDSLAAKVTDLRNGLVNGNPTALVPGTDVPVIALAAYQRAASYGNRLYRGCDASWWHVAGIGRVESNHGRFGGSRPNRTGDVLPPIRGIPLDGSRSLAISDTDAGALDGDPLWDRAVGPTQFIPATWRGYASRFDLDADGDGSEDPDNLFDAARATGIYLCRNAGGSLTQLAAVKRALRAYNPSAEYERAVVAQIERYGGNLVPDLEGVGDPSPPGNAAPELPPPTTAPVPVGEPDVPDGPASVGADPDATTTSIGADTTVAADGTATTTPIDGATNTTTTSTTVVPS